MMGVTIGEGSVLALGSLATRDLEPWTVYGGVPAKAIKHRQQSDTLHHQE
jgi:putative colanic acid biosynthesis acetyltransferase WcaF